MIIYNFEKVAYEFYYYIIDSIIIWIWSFDDKQNK